MPVRYDIAAGVPQQQGGLDPLNAFATMQAMDYRQQQNALAQMQMQEYQRKLQAMAQMRGLPANFEDPRFAQQAFGIDPETGMQLQGVYRQSLAQKAAEAAHRATAAYQQGKLNLDTREFAMKAPGIRGEAREKIAKGSGEEIKIAQRLLAPAFMDRTPEGMAAKYAEVYGDLPEMVRKRLGPRPDMGQITALFETPEQIAEARKPMLKAPGQMVIQGTGRPGEFTETEPGYLPPNALATNQPGLNALAAQGRMPPVDMSAPDVDPIIRKQMEKQAQLSQLPPGPARETAGARMDLRDTLDQLEAGYTGLAIDAGIPKAGASNADNWKAAFRKSQTGQALGSLSDSETNARLATLRTAAAVLKQQLRKGLDMGVTQMDAVKEMEKLDKAFLDPDKVKGLSEAYGSIQVLRNMIGAGGGQPARTERGKAGEAPDLDAILGIK